MCIIEVHPSSDLCLEEEGGVMFPVVTDHANQIEFRLTGLLFRHPVKQLQREKREEEINGAAEPNHYLPLYADDTDVYHCIYISDPLLLIPLLLTSPRRRQVPRV